MSKEANIQSKDNHTIDFSAQPLSSEPNYQTGEDLTEKQSIDNISEYKKSEESDANENMDELENQCDCCECRIRRNSNFSTEQLPIDTQLPMALMSESLMFCTIL